MQLPYVSLLCPPCFWRARPTESIHNPCTPISRNPKAPPPPKKKKKKIATLRLLTLHPKNSLLSDSYTLCALSPPPILPDCDGDGLWLRRYGPVSYGSVLG